MINLTVDTPTNTASAIFYENTIEDLLHSYILAKKFEICHEPNTWIVKERPVSWDPGKDPFVPCDPSRTDAESTAGRGFPTADPSPSQLNFSGKPSLLVCNALLFWISLPFSDPDIL